MKLLKWKTLSQKDVSPSKWFPIVKEEVELPNGHKTDYYKSHLANVAMIIPVTKDNEVVFVRQYKHGVGEICVEFPAGRIESDKTPKQTAVSELLEETGIHVEESDLIDLTELWTEPSKSTVRVFGFLVFNVEITQDQNLEETEAIELLKIPLSELDDFVLNGSLHASDSLALLSVAKMRYSRIFDID